MKAILINECPNCNLINSICVSTKNSIRQVMDVSSELYPVHTCNSSFYIMCLKCKKSTRLRSTFDGALKEWNKFSSDKISEKHLYTFDQVTEFFKTDRISSARCVNWSPRHASYTIEDFSNKKRIITKDKQFQWKVIPNEK